MRDLGAVFDREEPLPHPACDQAQQNMRDGDREASPRRHTARLDARRFLPNFSALEIPAPAVQGFF
jgi:hypothetical protein